MFKEEHLPLLAINPELKDLVAARLESGNYTDALLSSFRHLTNVPREQSGEGGDELSSSERRSAEAHRLSA